MKNIGICLSAPTSVELTLTKACNHKCLHCYNPWRKCLTPLESGFTSEQLKIIIDELKKNNVWHVTLSGGEPLTRPDILFEAARLLNDTDITFSINTNLSLMDKEMAKELKFKYNLRTLILTSLPSIQEELCDKITQIEGSYKNILRGIRICKEHDFKVGINIVISKMNINDLSNIKDFIINNRIDYLCVSIVIPPTYDSENPEYYLSNQDIVRIADTLIELNKKYNIDVDSITPIPICIIKDIDKYFNIISTTCSAGLSRCTIDTDGNIFACSHEEKPYGNIFVDGLSTSWAKMTNWREGKEINLECKECEYLSICGGECRMMHNIDNKYYQLDKDAAIKYSYKMDTSNIKSNTKYEVTENIKIRDEEFGAAIRINYNEYYITHNVLTLYKMVLEKKVFFVRDILEYVEENEHLYNILYYMNEIGIIKRIN